MRMWRSIAGGMVGGILLSFVQPVSNVRAQSSDMDHDMSMMNMPTNNDSSIENWICGLSIMLLILVSVLFLIRMRKVTYRTRMSGMMVVMGISMITGLAIGTLAGLLLQNTFEASIIGVVSGLICAFLSSRPKEPLDLLDGALSAIMGGMMGAMLGVMVEDSEHLLTIGFIDLMVILVYFILYRIIKQETAEGEQASASDEACCS